MQYRTRSDSISPCWTIGLAAAFLYFLPAPCISAQTTFTVNTATDEDDGTCDAAHCSLREAITAANLDAVGGIIHFSIPGAGPHTIQPLTALPALEGDVIIDGTSEPDFAGTPVIELDGRLAGGAHGIESVGSQNLIRGLVINRFEWNGIQIQSGCTFNVIEGNFIGTDVTGTIGLGNGNAGVLIGQATNNTVGGATASARNLISGNPEGVTIVDPTATGNLVSGNYIGTDITGTQAIPNVTGVLLLAPGNTVGGTAAGSGNIISGNHGNGVVLDGEHASGNTVLGNLIGTDATGGAPLGNGEHGLAVLFASTNTIGGTDQGAGNVLSGNGVAGVFILGENGDGNVIQGNFIGTDISGTAAIGNFDTGVTIHTGRNNTIGGTEAGSRNVISGNHNGILIADLLATENRIQGNYIGTNAAGTLAVPNADMGILVWGTDNTIGGSENGAGNVISGNTSNAVALANGSSGTVIQGNLIGTDATGTTNLANGLGVLVDFSADNIIGGTGTGARNVISGNPGGNITIFGVDATNNLIQGNYIGTDISGLVALEVGRAMHISDAPGNTVGGAGPGAGNLIAGNGNGILIEGPNASGNIVQGNSIGVDATGLTPLENGGAGVRLSNGASGNTIGGTASGAGNIIANGRWMGVILFADAGTRNRIQSNAIFGNSALGIELGRDSVTPNDEGDTDTGPNDLQNYPILTSVASGDGAVIQANLNSAASSSYTVEFFSNQACDDSGFGQGQTPLGSASLNTDPSGNGIATASFSSVSGTVFTATATDTNGNTSEFSQCSDASTIQLTASPITRTVSSGQSATYTISATTEGGAFEETLALTCSGAPGGTTCTFADDNLTIDGGQASTTMTVTTVAPSTFGPLVQRPTSSHPRIWPWALFLLLPGVVLAERAIRASSRPSRPDGTGYARVTQARWAVGVAGVFGLLILQASCGGDNTSPPTGGTNPGTYELTVTATWESFQQTTTATLVVQ